MATLVVRVGMFALRFTVLRSTLDRGVRAFGRVPSTLTAGDVRRVGWSVAAVTRRLPFHSTCLVQSLAVDAMLRRRGAPSKLCVGVQPPSGGILTAHAWVEHDGQVVFGARTDPAEYRVLVRQGAR